MSKRTRTRRPRGRGRGAGAGSGFQSLLWMLLQYFLLLDAIMAPELTSRAGIDCLCDLEDDLPERRASSGSGSGVAAVLPSGDAAGRSSGGAAGVPSGGAAAGASRVGIRLLSLSNAGMGVSLGKRAFVDKTGLLGLYKYVLYLMIRLSPERRVSSGAGSGDPSGGAAGFPSGGAAAEVVVPAVERLASLSLVFILSPQE